MYTTELFGPTVKPYYIPGLPKCGTVERGTLADIAKKFTDYEEPSAAERKLKAKDLPKIFKKLGIIEVRRLPEKKCRKLYEGMREYKKSLEKRSLELYGLAEDLFMNGSFNCGMAEPRYDTRIETIDNMPNWKFLLDPPGKYTSHSVLAHIGDTLDVLLEGKDKNLNGCLHLINEPDEKWHYEYLTLSRIGEGVYVYNINTDLVIDKLHVLTGKKVDGKYYEVGAYKTRKELLKVLRKEFALD